MCYQVVMVCGQNAEVIDTFPSSTDASVYLDMVSRTKRNGTFYKIAEYAA